jgi:1-deoxy-D-xylulose-5-phosphate reductoisomerase
VKRRIAILGSTGSIGRQALDIIRTHGEHFEAEVLTANNNASLLIEQALEFSPNAVVIADESAYAMVKEALEPHHIKVFAGEEALASIVEMETIDLVLAAIVGFAGLRSTMRAIESGKQLALANKESLVVAGDLITALAREKAVNIYPVDSEHSAIFQCLAGEFHNPVEKIYLTASGGPFYGKNSVELKNTTPAEALNHPKWNMGNKITIDSATLMNKGLEVIEARWLFNLKPSQIEVVVHPQSIIHSMVQFCDGSVKAQMGIPDMKLPIQYAFSYPARLKTDTPRIDFGMHTGLTFGKPDTETFRCLALAYEALNTGGNMPCILNAANEIAVGAFLNGQLGFNDIPGIIEQTMQKIKFIDKPGMSEYSDTDREARLVAADLIKTKI